MGFKTTQLFKTYVIKRLIAGIILIMPLAVTALIEDDQQDDDADYTALQKLHEESRHYEYVEQTYPIDDHYSSS